MKGFLQGPGCILLCWTCRNQAAAAAVVQEAAATQQQLQLRSLLVEPSWLQVLQAEFDKPYMEQLQGFLQQEWQSHTIYPPKDSIFRAFNAVPFDQVRSTRACGTLNFLALSMCQ